MEDFTRGSNSFSGTDIRPMVVMPSAEHKEPIYQILPNLQTISYSVFREKTPARSLGFIGEKGRARGTRTIAGSMVFTVFDRHPFFDLLRTCPGDPIKGFYQPQEIASREYIHPDQLPPFDIILQFANEYGHAAELILYGVELQSEGQVHSISDLITENVCQFTAGDVITMYPGGYKASKGYHATGANRTFSSIMNREVSAQTSELIRNSHNPFR